MKIRCLLQILSGNKERNESIYEGHHSLNCKREKTLFLTVDGRVNYELTIGETVRITRSPLITRFVRLKNGSFYDRLRQKMTDK